MASSRPLTASQSSLVHQLLEGRNAVLLCTDGKHDTPLILAKTVEAAVVLLEAVAISLPPTVEYVQQPVPVLGRRKFVHDSDDECDEGTKGRRSKQVQDVQQQQMLEEGEGQDKSKKQK